MFGFLKKKHKPDEPKATAIDNASSEPTPSTTVAVVKPSDSEIETLYVDLLEKLAVPEGARSGLLKQSIDTKWKMLAAHCDLLSVEVGKEQTPQYWLTKLSEHTSTNSHSDNVLKDMRELKVVINTANKQWLLDFCQGKGILALSNYFSTFSSTKNKVSQSIQSELLLALRGLMNNEMGMENALSVSGLLDSVICCLNFSNLIVAKQIIEMLSV